MRTLIRPALVVLVGALLAAPAWAGLTLTGKPKLELLVTGNVMNFEGASRTVTVADDGTTLTFTMPIASVDTGIGLRNSHIQDKFVGVDKHPDAILALPKASVTFPSATGESTSGEVQADFTLRGVKLAVPVTYTVKRGKDSWKIEAEFPFNVEKHGVTEPLAYLGVGFYPDMRAKVALELVDAP